jgi:plasmid stabilization system protein ParE
MMQVLFFEEANAEIEEGRAWYRRRSEVAEAALLRELNHAIEMVAEAPLRWAKYIAGTRRYVFPTYPYSLIFFVANDAVNVVAVAHDKRKPGYWRKRLRH